MSMQKNMSICVNGQSQVPPGFRFHPTEEELLQYYLRKKVCYEKIDLDVIRDVDLNKLEPWDIQEKCKIGSTPQNDWYFFSHKDKKYPTGTRTNRATAAGFWKATGRDKVIYGNGKRIGMRKTLVFYKGRAPHGQKSDWIMHEYRLEDNLTSETCIVTTNVMGDGGQEEGWVVCRIFKKKNHLKTLESPLGSGETRRTSQHQHRNDVVFDSCEEEEEGGLEQILEQMGRSCCKEEEEEQQNDPNGYNKNGIRMGRAIEEYQHEDRFSKLPRLESPKSNTNEYHPMMEGSYSYPYPYPYPYSFHHHQHQHHDDEMEGGGGMITNWAALDRLVASQLNGQSEDSSFNAAYTSNNNNTTTTTTVDPTMGYCSSDHLQLPTLRSSSASSSSISSSFSTAPNNNNYITATHDNYSNTTTQIDLWNFARSTSSLLLSTSSQPL